MPSRNGPVNGEKQSPRGKGPWASEDRRKETSLTAVLFAVVLAGFADAAANGGVVQHQAAGAAGFHHAAQAIAACLDHFAALAVAAGAGQADARVGHVALAHAHGQIAGA